MSTMADDLTSALRSVTTDWKKAKRKADQQDRVARSALQQMRRFHNTRTTVKEVAFRVMEAAYQKASGGGRYPANARQVYYAARPSILSEADCAKVDSQYFTQTLLKEYMEDYQPDWDIVYDARGHITEPHREKVVGLGGLEVRDYIGSFTRDDFTQFPEYAPKVLIPTTGPRLRYGGVLFIEKEGFDPLLKAARISERFDLAIASTKGLPVSACCDLLWRLKGCECKTYVLHDFDKSGFSIVSALRHGTRGSRGSGEIVDLGFRLEDIEGLQREEVTYDQKSSFALNLRENGATEEEIAILVQGRDYRHFYGERVELNAMMADEFIAWLERKLQAHGVEKVIPDEGDLAAAYRRAVFQQTLEKRAGELRDEIMEQKTDIPDDLARRVTDLLHEDKELSWDGAVWEVASMTG